MNRTTLWAFAVISFLLILLSLLTKEQYQNLLVYKVETSTTTYDIYNEMDVDISFIKQVPALRNTRKNKEAKHKIIPAYDINNKQDVVVTCVPGKVWVVMLSKVMNISKFEHIKDGAPVHVHKSSSVKIDILQALIGSRKVSIRTDNDDGDVMMVCGTSKDIMDILQRQPLYKILDYEAIIDIHALKVQIPYAQVRDVDCNKEFGARERFPIFKCIYFDIFMVSQDPLARGYEHAIYDLVTLPELREEFAKNNYYTMYFEYHHVTLQYLRRHNSYIHKKDGLTILEQFANQSEMKIVKNVDGYLEGDIFTMTGDEYDFPKNMKVILVNQERPHENGEYTAVNETILLRSKAYHEQESAFRCYADAKKTTQQECGSTWDRPCVRNEECPFFQANKNYPNYRGGCNDGFCEFPMGIERVSYRQHNKNGSKAICHGCPHNNPTCCDTQKSPDYAFELDSHERLKMH